MSILAAPENPWVAQALHSIFGVAAPEETVKILVIVAVSARRRPFADPMDTVIYGAAAGLGFAAYENLAYLVQHAGDVAPLAALRSVLTVPFHGALGIIAGAYLAIARSGTALGAHRHHRDWARISSRILVLFAPIALHAAFDFPLLTLQQNPDIDPSTRLMLGSTSVLIGFSSIAFAMRLVRRVGRHHAPRTEIARERLSQLRRMWALLVLGGGAGFAGLAFVLTSIHHYWLVNPERHVALVLVPVGLVVDPDRHRPAGGHHGDLFPRPQPDARDVAGLFLGPRSRLGQLSGALDLAKPVTNKFDPAAPARAIIRHHCAAPASGDFQ